MKLKKYISVISTLLLTSCIFSSCAINKPITTLADLSFEKTGQVNNEIYILEGGEYKPYIVVTDDYNGYALLLRKYVLDEPHRISEYYSYYENSEIDDYLNTTFLSNISEIENYVVESNVVIVADNAIGKSGDETKTIKRQVFLLSLTELGVSSIEQEGTSFSYFKNENNRMATKTDLTKVPLWVRTPDSSQLSRNFYITTSNGIDFTNASAELYVRPAFCLDKNLKVKMMDNTKDGKIYYVLDI